VPLAWQDLHPVTILLWSIFMLDQLLVLVWQAMQSLFPTKAVGM
jgi:hypothetical protein